MIGMPAVSGARSEPTRDLDSVATLGDRARRALYAYVASQDRPVSRDEAAGATGMKRPTVAFHLDRLVEEGLLEAAFARVSGRTGPGAGRTAKLYTRARRQIDVSLPPRRYEIVGDILAGAVEDALESPVPLGDAVAHAAERAGRRLAAGEGRAESGQHRQLPAAAERRLCDLLARAGYEPRATPAGDVQLANCPFHELAARHTRLVCEMNRRLLQGLLDELRVNARATLDPAQGRCCVAISFDEKPGARPGPPA
jgi:predicted ArsR family transcriptional regulator